MSAAYHPCFFVCTISERYSIFNRERIEHLEHADLSTRVILLAQDLRMAVLLLTGG